MKQVLGAAASAFAHQNFRNLIRWLLVAAMLVNGLGITATPAKAFSTNETTTGETWQQIDLDARLAHYRTLLSEAWQAAILWLSDLLPDEEPTILTLHAKPEVANPGDVIVVYWEMSGPNVPKTIDLTFHLPNAFSVVETGTPVEEIQPTAISAPGEVQPTPTQTSPVPPIEKEGVLTLSGAATSGVITVTVAANILGPYTLQATATGDQTDQPYTAGLTLLSDAALRVDASGGQAQGLDGQVKIIFPPESLAAESSGLDVRIRTLPAVAEEGVVLESFPADSLSGQPFEITAENPASKMAVSQFPSAYTLQVQYDDSRYASILEEESLAISYYDEDLGTWVALPTLVDVEANLLTTLVDHLTVFDFNVQDWQAARLPSLKNFQVSGFSGAGSYSVGIEVPAGTGGLQPSLGLSYSSQSVDSAGMRTQSSWAGMGWALDLPNITRNSGKTLSVWDDSFTLEMNGAGGQLLPISGNASERTYRLADDNFYRIRQVNATLTTGADPKNSSRLGDPSYWVVEDQAGNVYYFEQRTYMAVFSTSCSTLPQMFVWRWSLTRVVNIFGQEMTYSYTDNSETSSKTGPYGCSDSAISTHAIYPDEIRYAGGHYLVKFITEARYDYDVNWRYNPSYTTLFERRRLKEIQVLQDDDGSAGTTNDRHLVRKYVLTYAAINETHIFPSAVWPTDGQYPSADYKTNTLIRVQEYGSDGTSTLPATTFIYADGMHLTKVENGYGGEVQVSYTTPWYEIGDTSSGRKVIERVNWMAQSTGPTNWATASDSPTTYRPGGVYYIDANIGWDPERVNLGLEYASGQRVWVTVASSGDTNGDGVANFQGYVILPAGASSLKTTFSCQTASGGNDSCAIITFRTYNVLNRYPVNSYKRVDGVQSKSATFQYLYDGAATNDAAHSDYIKYPPTPPATTLTPALAEFRGHALSVQLSPSVVSGAQLAGLTWYYQDDARRGQSHTSLSATATYTEPFTTSAWSDYSGADWAANSGTPTLERVTGDLAVKVTSSNQGIYRQPYSLQEGESVILQYRLAADSQAIFSVAAGAFDSTYRRWGVKVGTGSQAGAWLNTCTSSTNCTDTAISGAGTPVADTWYTILLIVGGSGEFTVRHWRTDDYNANNWVYRAVFSSATGPNWRFVQKTTAGTTWLDMVIEGNVYGLSHNQIEVTNTATVDASAYSFPDPKVYWTYPLQSQSLRFDGADWTAVRSTYEYNTSDQGGTQYGHATRVYEAAWNGSAWANKRWTYTRYFPNVSSAYLAGLPAYQHTYACAGGTCDTDYADILATWHRIYDSSSSVETAPTQGKPTGQRTFLRWSGAGYTNPLYSDIQMVYDSYGNVIETRRYTQENTYSGYATGTYIADTVTYDPTYHTYPIRAVTALAQSISTGYDYIKGLPTTLADANGMVTYAEYDVFGRIVKIVRPGDSSASPTVSVSYTTPGAPFSNNPFYTTAVRKLDASNNRTVRKYYNSLGQLIQVQQPDSTLADGACSTADGSPDTCRVIANMGYDAYGRAVSQSVPVAAANGSAYYTTAISQQTTTTYDDLGRVTRQTSPDTTHTDSSYTLFTTIVSDPNGSSTVSTVDEWGRTTWVKPPAGAWIEYQYDTLDQLTTVKQYNYNTTTNPFATTSLSYDNAGRKTQMVDPDLGTWGYGYNALGQLTRQDDAKSQRICLYYDTLSRLTGKYYTTTATSCPSSPTMNVSNSYDGLLRQDDFDGSSLPSGWTASASGVTVSGGNLNITGAGNWNVYAYRNTNVGDRTSVRILFKVSTTSAVGAMLMDAGDWGQSNYRRWSLYWTGGTLYRESYVGTTNERVALLTLKANTWYEAVLTLDSTDQFRAVVWEKDNPAIWAQNSAAHSDWDTQSWKFVAQAHTGVLTIDQYKEQSAYAAGQRVSTSDSSGSASWTYDLRGRVASASQTITGSGTHAVKWTYNSADMPVTMTYPDGEVLTSSYLPQGALNSLTSSLGDSYVYSTAYDAAGRIDLRKIGGAAALQVDYTYFAWNTVNGAGRLKRITAGTNGNPTSLLDLQYYTGTDTPTYDAAGNLLSIRDYKVGSPQVQIFTYDSLNRLDSAKAESGTDGNYSLEDYTYDGAGRLSAKPPTGTLGYQDSAHIHAATHINGVQKYWYDANGNMTKRISGSDTYDLAYDQENCLIEVKKNSVVMASFTYNGDGARVKQALNGVTTAFVGEYYEVTGSAVRKNYHAGAQLVATRDSGTLRYVFGDHLGSSTVTADASGGNVTRQLFKAWGETRSSASLGTKYQYTGQYAYNASTEFGLLFYRSRFYDPALGRFASADTDVPESQGVQAFDRYAYVNNAPTRWTDSSGHGVDCGIGEKCRIEEKKVVPPPLPPQQDSGSSYSDWNSGTYSGCTMCHYAKSYNKMQLTNDELAQADQNMYEWAAIGYTPLVVTTIAVGGAELAALKTADTSISLFRAVGQNEGDDILLNQMFRPRPGGGSMDAK